MKQRMCAIAAIVLCSAGMTSCGGRTLRLEGNNMVQGASESSMAKQPTTIEPLTVASLELTTENEEPSKIEIDLKMPADYKLKTKYAIYIDTVMQKPELPTGCEITALTELMNYYGFEANKVEMADIFMANDQIGYYTMNEAFIGNPHHDDGFGCNAPVIVKAANDYFDYIGSDWYAADLSGSPIEEILSDRARQTCSYLDYNQSGRNWQGISI